jgi:precorrin-6x reductase
VTIGIIIGIDDAVQMIKNVASSGNESLVESTVTKYLMPIIEEYKRAVYTRDLKIKELEKELYLLHGAR